jgi:predicted nucleotidyltransferase
MRKVSSGSVKIFYPRYSRPEVITRLSQGGEEILIQLPLDKALLFGTWASGRHTAASDIDILVIYQGEPIAGAYALVKRSLDLPGVEPHVYSSIEAKQIESTIEKMTKRSITLYPKE